MNALKLIIPLFLFFCILPDARSQDGHCPGGYVLPTDISWEHNGETITVEQAIACNFTEEVHETRQKEKAKEIADAAFIRSVMKREGLMQEPDLNIHLKMDKGDISFLSQQEHSRYYIEGLLSAMRIVLDDAEEAGIIISNKGDLTFFAQELMSISLQAIASRIPDKQD